MATASKQEIAWYKMMGMNVEILPCMKVQVKTHHNRLINWIFKKMYGYRNEYILDEYTPAVVVGNTIYLRDESVVEILKECCDEVKKDTNPPGDLLIKQSTHTGRGLKFSNVKVVKGNTYEPKTENEENET